MIFLRVQATNDADQRALIVEAPEFKRIQALKNDAMLKMQEQSLRLEESMEHMRMEARGKAESMCLEAKGKATSMWWLPVLARLATRRKICSPILWQLARPGPSWTLRSSRSH